MSDWPRYPIPNVPGWNNGDSGPTFSFAYDDGTDVLTITASADVMSGAESLRLVVDAANYDIGLASFVVDSGTQITVADASAIATGELTQVDVYEDDNTTVLIGVATGSATLGVALTYPTLTNICSPAADTIRFEGTNFLNATAGAVGYAVTRGDAAFLGGPGAIFQFADAQPDGNGWTLVTHTDTVIELHNPNFEPTDTVDGVAFHSADTINMYYYEPWGDPSPYSALVDGAGCP